MKLIFLYVHSLSMQYIYIDARALVFLFVVDVGCDVCVCRECGGWSSKS